MSLSVAEHCHKKQIAFGELLERSGLEEDRLRAIVLGRWTPSPTERARVAEAIGTPIDDIAWGHKTPVQHIYGFGPS